jgi:hypothetical protein
LSSVGVEQAGKDAVEFLSAFRSGPKTYLAKDHQRLERLIRVIVRGGTPTCRILPHVIIVLYTGMFSASYSIKSSLYVSIWVDLMPKPCCFDNLFKVRVMRLPTQFSDSFSTRTDEYRRVSGSSCGINDWNGFPRDH